MLSQISNEILAKIFEYLDVFTTEQRFVCILSLTNLYVQKSLLSYAKWFCKTHKRSSSFPLRAAVALRGERRLMTTMIDITDPLIEGGPVHPLLYDKVISVHLPREGISGHHMICCTTMTTFSVDINVLTEAMNKHTLEKLPISSTSQHRYHDFSTPQLISNGIMIIPQVCGLDRVFNGCHIKLMNDWDNIKSETVIFNESILGKVFRVCPQTCYMVCGYIKRDSTFEETTIKRWKITDSMKLVKQKHIFYNHRIFSMEISNGWLCVQNRVTTDVIDVESGNPLYSLDDNFQGQHITNVLHFGGSIFLAYQQFMTHTKFVKSWNTIGDVTDDGPLLPTTCLQHVTEDSFFYVHADGRITDGTNADSSPSKLTSLYLGDLQCGTVRFAVHVSPDMMIMSYTDHKLVYNEIYRGVDTRLETCFTANGKIIVINKNSPEYLYVVE